MLRHHLCPKVEHITCKKKKKGKYSAGECISQNPGVFESKDARRSIQELDFIIQLGLEELLPRDKEQSRVFSVITGQFRIDVSYKRTVPALLICIHSLFLYISLSFCFPCPPPSRLVSIRLCPCMTVKKLSIQRKWKCHTAGDSAIGLSGFCYNLPFVVSHFLYRVL